jgi:hypothetical protein
MLVHLLVYLPRLAIGVKHSLSVKLALEGELGGRGEFNCDGVMKALHNVVLVLYWLALRLG